MEFLKQPYKKILKQQDVGRHHKVSEYFAAGVGGAITGRGADLLIIDDPHSEQDAMSGKALESAYEWYTSGPRQRLQQNWWWIVLVMTRWSTKDLTGMLVKNQTETKLISGTWSNFQRSWTTDQCGLNIGRKMN